MKVESFPTELELVGRIVSQRYVRSCCSVLVPVEDVCFFPHSFPPPPFSTPPSVRGSRPGKNVQLTEAEIRGLCLKSREIFLSQPILLELEAPLKICGEHVSHHSTLFT